MLGILNNLSVVRRWPESGPVATVVCRTVKGAAEPWGGIGSQVGSPPLAKRPPRVLRLRSFGRDQSAGGLVDDGNGSPNKSLSECYFAGKGTALVLPQNERIRPSRRVSISGCDIQHHLQSMFYLLRPEDTLKMAVKLESVHPGRTRYLVVVSCIGRQDTEECCLLGIDCNELTTIGLVLRVLADTTITLDGDGGFSVAVCGQQHIFKPVSVQAMWSALQTLHKVSSKARENNYFLGGLTHDWVNYYEQRIESDRSCLNEWHAMDCLESRRPPSPDSVRCKPSEREETERVIRSTLKEIMMSVDLDEVTSKHIRGRLEEELDMDLGEYKPFIDQEMITILGQMDAATEIFDHVYLGSEWNASNHEELLKNGVRHILNVTREIDNFFPGMFDYLNVRVYDDEKTDLLKHWDDTFKYITRARAEGSKVLVHCKMGVSRSASVVIAYAMKAFGWDFTTAFDYVKRKRSCIKPNGSFITQLETYQGILDAMKNKEKLQRSKSETNLKASRRFLIKQTVKEEKKVDGGDHGARGEGRREGEDLNASGAELAQIGLRPKSWSPENGTNCGQESQAPLSQSLEHLLNLDSPAERPNNSCTCPSNGSPPTSRRRTSHHLRIPCGDGQYSVSPNRVVYLTSVRRRVSELEKRKRCSDGVEAGGGGEEGWDPGERRLGGSLGRGSSWGSYDMRPSGTVHKTKQRLERDPAAAQQQLPPTHYASSPTLTSPPEPPIPGLVKNLKREFEAKSSSSNSETAKSLPSSPVSTPPLEDLSVKHLVGHYEAVPSPMPPSSPQPPPKVVFVVRKKTAPSVVLASVSVCKKQQGKTHPLTRLAVDTGQNAALFNTM